MPVDTVQNVKMKIKDQLEILPDQQQLFLEDMELKNDCTLSDYAGYSFRLNTIRASLWRSCFRQQLLRLVVNIHT